MSMIPFRSFWQRGRLPLAVGLASSFATPVFAVSFNIGEIEGQFDSSLSVSTAWSTASPDQHLVGANNGGRGLSQWSDDGRLNFKRGDAFSKRLEGIHGLELKYGDTGVFLRGKYWYDFELKDEDRPFKAISDSGRKAAAKSSGTQLLDAFVYHNYSVGDLPGTVRVGRQVVSWGESTFIGNGIDSINPIDVSAFRRPGIEIKQGLVPTNLFYLSQNLTDNLSAEGFYQLEWDPAVVDNCGTFFSQTDVLADGCNRNLAVSGTSTRLNRSRASSEGVVVHRDADRDARDSGQFGLALHYTFEPLNTEFGAYYMNYHSRQPIFSSHSGGGTGSYFVEYPEDIHLYGLSFSTTLPTGTAWRGELSYRPNAPVQVNTTDILYASLSPTQGSPEVDQPGYRRKEITQFQTTLTQVFDQVMGADRFTLVGEVGWTHVGGLGSTSTQRYGRDPSYGFGPRPNGQCQALNAGLLGGAGLSNVGRYCESDGFTTADAWGYRVRGTWDFNNAIAGINLKPSVAWSQDVDGYSPGPGGNFEEGRKAISVGLEANYLSTYTASLYYTNFFDGKYSTVDDRDFVAMGVGMQF